MPRDLCCKSESLLKGDNMRGKRILSVVLALALAGTSISVPTKETEARDYYCT